MSKRNTGLWLAAMAAVAIVAAAVAVGLTLMLQSPAGAVAAGGPAAAGGGPGGPGGGPPPGPPPARVRLGQAQVQEVQDHFELTGRLQEIRRATVAAEVEGKVVALRVDEGDPLVGGQTVIAQIEDVWARLDLAAAEAEVAAAQAELDQSQRDLAYLESLLASGAAKPKEVADARADVAADQARLDAAIADRDRAQQEVQRLAVVAPFDGVVVRKLTEVGQWVTQGTPVAEIISRGQIDAVIDVPERLINLVREGTEVDVYVEPLDEHVTGQVVSITPSGTNPARTFPVKVRMDNPDGRLKAGMSVIARLPVRERSPRLTVPRDAVQFTDGSAMVWVPKEGQGPMPLATPVPVEVLFGVGDRYAIDLPDLGAAETLTNATPVVVEGAEMLFPGRPLIVMDTALAAEE